MSATNSSSEEIPSETKPLLEGPIRPEPDEEYKKKAKKHARKSSILVGITAVAVGFGNYLSYAPEIQILEQIICRRQTPLGEGLDPDSKPVTIQSDLAPIVGWMSFWNQVSGIVLTLPYSFAADRICRKPVMLLSLIGLILEEVAVHFICWRSANIPIEAIWATPLFQLLGGGPQIATSMAVAITSDMFPLSQRSSIFFVLSAALLLGEILATPISALTMSWSSWFPFLAGVAFELTGLISAFAASETRPESPPRLADSGDQRDFLEQQSSCNQTS